MILPRTPQTPAAVAAHYDALDAQYRAIWGEHVHHGYWARGDETPAQAADALTALVGERLDLSPGMAVCDIGCGYGATAAWLAARYDVRVAGVTLSARQLAVAQARSPSRGEVAFRRQDWLDNGFADAAFDRAYAIESTEHMADKARCFGQAARVLRPGGVLVVCAWLAADHATAWQQRHLLRPICEEGRLPGLGTEAEYRALLAGAGFAARRVEDVSARVARTWTVCIRRGLSRLLTDPATRRLLLDRRQAERVFAATLFRLRLAFATGAMRYGVFTAARD